VALLAWSWLRPEPPRPVARYGLAFPPDQQLVDEGHPTFDLAPDGSFIAYVGPSEGGGQLWIKQRDRYEATALAGTTGARGPSVSPDGAWVAYSAGGAIRKIPVAGGAAITIADSANSSLRSPVAWLDDGTIVFVGRDWNIRRVTAAGGVASIAWTNPVERYPFFPVALPGSRGVLFSVCDNGCRDVRELWVLDLRSGEAKRLIEGALRGFYARTGHVVYILPDGRLFAAAFDVGRLELTGEAAPVLDQVKLDGGIADIALSSSGTLLMLTGTGDGPGASREAIWLGRDGAITPVDTGWRFDPSRNSGLAISPDGTKLAIGIGTDAGDDVWIKDLVGGQLSRLTFNEGEDARPRWSPDGRFVRFLGRRGDSAINALYMKRADGIGEETLLLRLRSSIWEAAVSPDGKWILARAGGTSGQTGGRDIFGVQPGIDTTPKPILDGAYDESAVTLSPDGRWLAYESNESGRKEIYVRPFPDTEAGRWQVSTGGASQPLWSRDGRELFYTTPTRDMMAAAIETRPGFAVKERKALFRLGTDIVLSNSYYTTFDISPDGRRFLMMRSIATSQANQARMILVENWFEELGAKVGK
jgi:serine/threonine-protein kinase